VSVTKEGGDGKKDEGYAPSAPTGIEAGTQSSSSISVSWSSVSGATSYRVYRSTSASGVYTEIGALIGLIGTSYTDSSGLSPNTTYYYKVSAVNSAGEGSQSTYTSATTSSSSGGNEEKDYAPSAPNGVEAGAQSSSSISVSWSSVSGATSYRVYRSTSASGAYTEIGSLIGTSYTDSSGLSPNTTYYYKVSAVNSAGEGSQSTYTSATTSSNAPSAPSAPTGLSAYALSSSDISLSWNPVSGATSYLIYRSDSAYGYYALIVGAMETFQQDYGLSPNTTYYYKVTAVNSAELESDYSSYTSVTTSSNAPSAPTGLSAYALSSSDISLSWNSVSGASYYCVYFSDSAYGVYGVAAWGLSETFYQSSALSPNTTYYFKVTAFNSEGMESDYSSYTSATTSSNTPFAPTFTGASASPYVVSLSWDSVSEASYYRIYRSNSATGTYTYIGETEYYYPYYEDYDVSPNTTYYYKVTTVSNAGFESDFSSYIPITTYNE
jgi:fibronectin type 3 domain-containing protein